MTIEQIRKAIKVDEFRPFTISLADGRRFPVSHPEFIWIPPEASRTILVGKGEDFSIIDLILVSSIDFGDGAARN